MSKHKPLAGTDLGKAVCKHFGLNPNHVDVVSQIDFRPQAMASIKLTIMLTAEDLAGIARAAGADGVQTFTATGDFCKPNQAATVNLDANASEMLRRYGCRVQPLEPGPELIRFVQPLNLIKGEALAIEPDSRLDEIVSLLKQLVQAVERKDFLGRDMGLPVRIVAAGGGSSGSTCECQRGSNPIPQPHPVR